jgi:hypothetical protein
MLAYLIKAHLSLFYDSYSLMWWQLTYYLWLILVALRSENLTV